MVGESDSGTRITGDTAGAVEEDADVDGPAEGRADIACLLIVAYFGELDVGESIEGSCAACRMIVTVRERLYKGCGHNAMVASRKERPKG
jgi:hypothetical protein